MRGEDLRSSGAPRVAREGSLPLPLLFGRRSQPNGYRKTGRRQIQVRTWDSVGEVDPLQVDALEHEVLENDELVAHKRSASQRHDRSLVELRIGEVDLVI